MSVELPDPLAERLAAEAARRGLTVEELALEAIEGRYGPSRPTEASDDGVDAVEAFIGCFDSGDPDWATTDTHILRAQAAERRPA
jgi:serine/threonine protein kinase HipA of HipAB toxin-antitoxin module